MTDTLKPCPFCGSEDVRLSWDDDYRAFMTCWKCEACGPTVPIDDAASEAWNLRPGEDAARREAEDEAALQARADAARDDWAHDD